MEHKDLLAAPGTELQVQVESSELRFRSRLIGIDRGRFIVIRPPIGTAQQGQITPRLVSGTPMAIRFLLDGTVWGFRTRVLLSLTGSTPAVFLAYPEQIENVDLRSSIRVESRIPAQLTWGRVQFPGIVADVSQSGARFVFRYEEDREIPRPDTAVELRIPAIAGTEGVPLTAMVRSLSEDRERVVLGLLFTDLEPAARQGIEAYIQEIREIVGD